MITDINALYTDAKRKMAVNVALLHIDEGQTCIVVEPDTENGLKTLPFGYKSVANDYFKHTPASESEIENAINDIEDQIMLIGKEVEQLNLQLVSFDKRILEIKEHSQTSYPALLTSDIEQVFTRLAAIITGRPAAYDALPTDNDFSAYLLILREVMHHIKFKDITVL